MPFDGTHIDAAGKVLLDAADLLERDGWCQFARKNRDGNMCAVGALSMAATGTELYPGFCDRLTKAAERMAVSIPDDDPKLIYVSSPFAKVMVWNDHGRRTKEEVIAAMRKAALAP